MPQAQVHYLNVLSAGPLIIIRVPWPTSRAQWRAMLTGLTAVMHSHGFKKKDLYNIESMTYFGPDSSESDRRMHPKTAANDEKLLAHAASAFEGNPNALSKFWLYTWDGSTFVLVRPGAE